jgi:hypothetical protein
VLHRRGGGQDRRMSVSRLGRRFFGHGQEGGELRAKSKRVGEALIRNSGAASQTENPRTTARLASETSLFVSSPSLPNPNKLLTFYLCRILS